MSAMAMDTSAAARRFHHDGRTLYRSTPRATVSAHFCRNPGVSDGMWALQSRTSIGITEILLPAARPLPQIRNCLRQLLGGRQPVAHQKHADRRRRLSAPRSRLLHGELSTLRHDLHRESLAAVARKQLLRLALKSRSKPRVGTSSTTSHLGRERGAEPAERRFADEIVAIPALRGKSRRRRGVSIGVQLGSS